MKANIPIWCALSLGLPKFLSSFAVQVFPCLQLIPDRILICSVKGSLAQLVARGSHNPQGREFDPHRDHFHFPLLAVCHLLTMSGRLGKAGRVALDASPSQASPGPSASRVKTGGTPLPPRNARGAFARFKA